MMSLTGFAERGYLKDWLIRVGIRQMLAAGLRRERRRARESERPFFNELRRFPIALETDAANRQHYEVPAEFFEIVLGPRLKYSSCLYEAGDTPLPQAEDAMLRLTCEHADVADGMSILDLGCGWGSLSLWIAEQYPGCRVTSLSNSRGQRAFIEARCRERGLDNVTVLTANIAEFSPDEFLGRFDRVLSVEMFEHMRNWEMLLSRISDWLAPEGKLFVHVFCHHDLCYPFETSEGDWITEQFFAGGMMPSLDLLNRFDRDLRVLQRWSIEGRHYARTCEDWLKNLDANRDRLLALFRPRYGAEAAIVLQRWRMFLMACAELFAYGKAGRPEWLVGHYLLEPVRCTVSGGRR